MEGQTNIKILLFWSKYNINIRGMAPEILRRLLKTFINHLALPHLATGDDNMIFGVTGFLASGKGEFSSYLASKGFTAYSLSDVVREEVRSRGQEITRELLQATANELRHKHGNDILARRIMKKLEPGKNYVIESIRNPDEIKALKRNKSFKLIYIDAPIELRFKRAKTRNREKEAITFDEFKRSEEKELSSPDAASQQLIKCREMSDLTIVNDSSKGAFHKKIDRLVEGLR